ncbi:MAG: ABC transporter substrate-binding protein, partial [Acidimicrobiia bacterium]
RPGRRRRRTSTLLAAVAALSLVAAACGGDDDEAGSDDGTTTSQPAGSSTTTSEAPLEKTTLTVIGVPQANVLPIFAAIEEGFFADRGLTVEFRPSASSRDFVPALLGGSADIAVPSISIALNASASGAPVKVIGTSGHATELRMAVDADKAAELGIEPGDPADEQLAKLKGSGLRIGVTAPGGGVHAQTSGILEARDISTSGDVELVPFDGGDAMLAGLEGDVVDAFVWNPPQTLALGDDVVLIEYRELEEYEGIDFIVLLAAAKGLEDNPATFQAFADGWVEGWQFVQDNPDEALEILRTVVSPGLDDALTEKLLESATVNFGPTPALTETGVSKGLALTNLGAPQQVDVSFADLVDNSFVNEAIENLDLDVPAGD